MYCGEPFYRVLTLANNYHSSRKAHPVAQGLAVGASKGGSRRAALVELLAGRHEGGDVGQSSDKKEVHKKGMP